MAETPKVENMQRLLRWMEERQRIYLKRKQGLPPPWTADPIMQRYRFCNVYREQDAVTEWIRVNWREPYADHPNLWFAMCAARQINWPPTLKHLGFPVRWSAKQYWKRMQECYASGNKIYTSAYMIHSTRCSDNSRDHYTCKGQYTIFGVLDPLWKGLHRLANPWPLDTLEHSCNLLRKYESWGGFMAYEAVTDMRHTRYLCNAKDIYTWANPGPGAKRGLNWIFERPVKQSVRDSQAVEEMRYLLPWVSSQRDLNLLPTLEMRDIEMSLCEFDKYCRVKEGIQRNGLEAFRPNMNLRLW